MLEIYLGATRPQSYARVCMGPILI